MFVYGSFESSKSFIVKLVEMSGRPDICWTVDDSPSTMTSKYSNQRVKKKQTKNKSKLDGDRTRSSSQNKGASLSSVQKTLNSSDKTSSTPETRSHPTLVDLSQEDKERIAKLIRELAKIGEEKDNVVTTLNEERQKFVGHIQRLEDEKRELVLKQELLSAEVKQFQQLLQHYETLVTSKDSGGSSKKEVEKVNKSFSVQVNCDLPDGSDPEAVPLEDDSEAKCEKNKDLQEQQSSMKLRNSADVELGNISEENGNSLGHPITVKELSDDDTLYNAPTASPGRGLYMDRSRLDANQYRAYLEEQKLKLLAEQKVLARLLHEQEQNLVMEWERRKSNEMKSRTAPPTPYEKNSQSGQRTRSVNKSFASTANKSALRQSPKRLEFNSSARSQSPLLRHSLSSRFLTSEGRKLDTDDANQLRRSAQSNSSVSSLKACESNLELSYVSAVRESTTVADDTEILNEVFFVI